MKIIVAYSTAGDLASFSGYRDALCALLEGAGHKVELLDLPSIAAPRRARTNIASYRLLRTAESADAIICLDAVAAVLRHPRKLILLLDDAYLDGDRVQLPQERPSERGYIANVLQAALEEAVNIFTLSRFASEGLRALSIERAQILQPCFSPSEFHYSRNPGPELLVLNSLDDRQRPDLVMACLAALPEPFRARWIAPYAPPARLARLRDLAQDAGLEHRLTFDVRAIGGAEKAFLLSQASALLELSPGLLAVGESVHHAIATGVPLITCTDGGALTEVSDQISTRPAKPSGTALATAVRAASAASASASPRPAPHIKSSAIEWAPLVKVLSR
ncbi:MAG: hypothetical protein LH466_03620 [Sphingomonas bacterium]|nr:hypothetical protein [Sphingomonas bacterium]